MFHKNTHLERCPLVQAQQETFEELSEVRSHERDGVRTPVKVTYGALR